MILFIIIVCIALFIYLGCTERLPYHPRLLNCIWALCTGYFWLPCPLCGKRFGGHEWHGEGIRTGVGTGEGVCPKCINAAAEYNKNVPEEWK